MIAAGMDSAQRVPRIFLPIIIPDWRGVPSGHLCGCIIFNWPEQPQVPTVPIGRLAARSAAPKIAINCQVKGSGHGSASAHQVVRGLFRIGQTWHQVFLEGGRVFAGMQVCKTNVRIYRISCLLRITGHWFNPMNGAMNESGDGSER
jgi:hypothetical protein